MGFEIDDGTGNGYSAKVNQENRLLTNAVTESNIEHTNFKEGRAFTVYGTANPAYEDPSATDTGLLCVFYLKNLSDLSLIISQMGIWTASNQYIEPSINPTGSPTNVTTLTPTNMNLSSGNIATGDFYSGDGILGLEGATRVTRFRIPANNSTNFNSLDSRIVIPKNNIFVLYSTESVQIEFTFNFFYHEI